MKSTHFALWLAGSPLYKGGTSQDTSKVDPMAYNSGDPAPQTFPDTGPAPMHPHFRHWTWLQRS
jgi:hypothetical protein